MNIKRKCTYCSQNLSNFERQLRSLYEMYKVYPWDNIIYYLEIAILVFSAKGRMDLSTRLICKCYSTNMKGNSQSVVGIINHLRISIQ